MPVTSQIKFFFFGLTSGQYSQKQDYTKYFHIGQSGEDAIQLVYFAQSGMGVFLLNNSSR
jgi:hypothetical protein